MLHSPVVEDLQPIQEKLNEATDKIYEALQLAAQLKLHPRYLGNFIGLAGQANEITQELLQAAQRPVETNFNRPLSIELGIGSSLRHYSPEELEEMKQKFAEEMKQRFAEEMRNRPIYSNNIGMHHPC